MLERSPRMREVRGLFSENGTRYLLLSAQLIRIGMASLSTQISFKKDSIQNERSKVINIS